MTAPQPDALPAEPLRADRPTSDDGPGRRTVATAGHTSRHSRRRRKRDGSLATAIPRIHCPLGVLRTPSEPLCRAEGADVDWNVRRRRASATGTFAMRRRGDGAKMREAGASPRSAPGCQGRGGPAMTNEPFAAAGTPAVGTPIAAASRGSAATSHEEVLPHERRCRSRPRQHRPHLHGRSRRHGRPAPDPRRPQGFQQRPGGARRGCPHRDR
jgi:hypothetical protein